MSRKTVSAIMMLLLVLGTIGLVSNVQPVEASGTIYIRADGSIDPPTAPIQRNGEIYTLTSNVLQGGGVWGNNDDVIVIERDNIVFDGSGFTIKANLNAPYPWLGNGIDLFGRSNVTIQNVNITDFNFGIFLNSSLEIRISGNNFTNNAYCIYLNSSSDCSINGNTINWLYGIFLDSSSENSISGNDISKFGGTGIWLVSSSLNNSMRENDIEKQDVGIFLDSSSDYNSMSENNVASNGGFGIRMRMSSNNSIVGNNVTNNIFGGITFDSSSYSNIIHDNFIENNTVGIGGPNYEQGESITASVVHSASAIASLNDTFYHNNVITNSQQVNTSSEYIWNIGYPTGGNYWSDYSGEDSYSGPYQNLTGSDGIGDTPYFIDANNTDNYPLMNPVAVHISGDINNDGKVSLQDLVLLALAYGSRPGDAKWNPNADINGNGVVDLADLVILALHYGQPKYQNYTDWYNGLVGYWKLDEGAGNMTADSSGNGNNGTLINDPAWVSGKYGEALNLNGTNYVSVPDSTSLQLQNFSLEAWIYMKEEPSQDSFASIIRRFGTDIEMSAIGYWLGFWQGSLELTVGDGLGGGVTPVGITQSALTLNEWHHVVATFDGLKATLYIDGLAKASYTYSGSFIFPPYYISSPLQLGTYMSNCTIDNVMVYNRSLSPEEVMLHYLIPPP